MDGKIWFDVKTVPSDGFCEINWETNIKWIGLWPDDKWMVGVMRYE